MRTLADVLLVAFVLVACQSKSDYEPLPNWPRTWYVTASGTKYGVIGPWPKHKPDYYPSDDDADEEYLTRAEMEAELDLSINAAAAAHGGNPAVMRSFRFVVVDDFGFRTDASPTGFAAGLVDRPSNAIFVSLWTRYEGTPDPASIPIGSPSWTHRPPGLNGYSMWRYGLAPYFPVMEHEGCHVYYPGASCGH